MTTDYNGYSTHLRADRQPCPVCGHPTGDCKTDDTQLPVHLLGPDAFPSSGHEEKYVVEEDVWQDRWISPFTQTRVRVAVKGTAIPMSVARELGIVTDD